MNVIRKLISRIGEFIDNLMIARMIKQRDKNDDGKRYTLEEVKYMREEILNRYRDSEGK